MNGVHDMGGMAGLGELALEANEPVFHAPWEARVFALNLGLRHQGRWNIDTARHHRELIPGADYLPMSYYERWLASLITLLLEAGLISEGELARGRPEAGANPAPPARTDTADSAETLLPARFRPGDAVRARNLHPSGHTRLPGYVRGRTGVITADRGDHTLPDAHAHGLGRQPQRLYNVRFTASELWGENAPARDAVHLDLWDGYLERADG